MRKINVDFQGNQSKKVKASGNSRRVIAKSNGNPEEVNSKTIDIFNMWMHLQLIEPKKTTEQKKSFKTLTMMIL